MNNKKNPNPNELRSNKSEMNVIDTGFSGESWKQAEVQSGYANVYENKSLTLKIGSNTNEEVIPAKANENTDILPPITIKNQDKFE